MITDIKIERFRGIKEGELKNITPLTVLVGPNGSGKSSLLEAMLIGASDTPKEQIELVINHRKIVQNAHHWLMWKRGLDGGARIITRFVRASIQHERSFELALNVDRKKEHILHYKLDESSDSQGYSLQGDITFSLNGYGRSQTDWQPSLDHEDLGLANMHYIAAFVEGEVSIENLYSQVQDAGQGKLLSDIVRAVIPSLEKIELLSYNNISVLRTSFENRSVPVAYAGDGIYALIRFIMELILAQDGVIFVEEPETHQHYRTIALSAKAIWEAVKRGIQVILTTHSMEFLDELLMARPEEMPEDTLCTKNVYLKEGCLKVAEYSGHLTNVARLQLGNDLR